MAKEIEQTIEDEFRKQAKAVEKPNIAVVGATGVGKSALINRIFGQRVTEEGVGKPITDGLDRCELEDLPIVLYDTEGYEVSKGDTTNFDKNIMPEFEEMNRRKIKDHLHLVWYCISIQNNRITDYDIELIRKFISINKTKTCVVLTQCDKDELLDEGSDESKGKTAEAIKQVIHKRGGMEHLIVFETCATNPDLLFDLDNLLEWSNEKLPLDTLRTSFAAAQISSIPLKKKRAYLIMLAAMSAAGATGFIPIPVSDAPLITAQQIAMCLGITKVFWGSTKLTGSVEAILKTQIMSLAGKQIAVSLTKFIPGLGSVISAATAALLTAALGAAVIEIHAGALKRYLEGEPPVWNELFGSDALIAAVKEAIKNKPWEKKS